MSPRLVFRGKGVREKIIPKSAPLPITLLLYNHSFMSIKSIVDLVPFMMLVGSQVQISVNPEQYTKN